MSWLGYMSVISSKDETGSSPLVFKNETKLLKAFLNGKTFFLFYRKSFINPSSYFSCLEMTNYMESGIYFFPIFILWNKELLK